jgi:hypothetical protein
LRTKERYNAGFVTTIVISSREKGEFAESVRTGTVSSKLKGIGKSHQPITPAIRKPERPIIWAASTIQRKYD